MPVPVISIAQMRDWEQATWAAGQQEAEVIRRVGRCVAHRALQLTQAGDSILILAGKGHNGDDARCAREHLPDRQVEVFDVTESATDLAKLDALLASRPALVVDGLFGIGLDRPLGPEWVSFIERVNAARLPVLAVDVPSGLNADTGEPQGAAIKAAVTLTVGAPKTGLLREAAWPFVGRLEVATDVGLAPCPHASELQWTLPEDFAGFPPARAAATHKGDYGHLAIVAGSLGYHGAAVLAARGAQRAQPGLITLHTLESVYHAVAPQLQAVMVSAWSAQGKLPGSHDSLLIGPGLAAADMPDQMKMLTRNLWRDSVPAGGGRCQRTGLAAAGPSAAQCLARHHAAPRRGGAAVALDPAAGAGQPAECLAQCLAAIRQLPGWCSKATKRSSAAARGKFM